MRPETLSSLTILHRHSSTKEAYRKDYLEFLAQYDGPIHVEYRDMRIVNSGDVGFVHALEQFQLQAEDRSAI